MNNKCPFAVLMLIFAHHLANLTPNSLGHMFWIPQEEHPDIPSLFTKVQEHLQKLNFNHRFKVELEKKTVN